MELWGWQHSRVEDVAAGPGPSERTGDPATKNQNQLHLLIGPTPVVLGRGDTKEPPSDEEVAGRAHVGNNVSEVLAFL